MDKKEILKAVDQDFATLSGQLKRAVALNDTYRQQKDGIKKSSVIYNQSEIESQLAKLKGTATVASLPLAGEIRDTLHTLDNDLAQLHRVDANDPALQNTLRVIRESKSISSDMARQLNEPFKRDQGALMVLRGAYESHGQQDALAETNAMIYDPGAAMKRVMSATGSFGSGPELAVNNLTKELALIARMEGQSNFNSMPDENGATMNDLIRQKIGM